ncbi:hypothetical protein P8452_06096 [Trifolium repens]|nr:hypothetical protein P8452_06096 [Trifolium repens]
MEIMELFDDICYTFCLQVCIPPLMDWASHRMTIETELIFYSFLILIILNYFYRFILWIDPSINVDDRIIAPMVCTIIFTHGFNLVDEPSTIEGHICLAIAINWALSFIFPWMDIMDATISTTTANPTTIPAILTPTNTNDEETKDLSRSRFVLSLEFAFSLSISCCYFFLLIK